jgi:hypothetical protein
MTHDSTHLLLLSDKFFMVWSPAKGKPTYQHPTLAEAKAEAERLCRQESAPFYVLESVKKCELADVRWTTIENPERMSTEFPF